MSKRKQAILRQELGVVSGISAMPGEARHRCAGGKGNGVSIITDNISGEILCGSCGQVLEERVSEILPYKQEPSDAAAKKGSDTVKCLTMFNMNISTTMSNRDGTGKSISGTAKNEFYRLKILNRRSTTDSKNKTLRGALLFLNMLQVKLGIPDAVAEDSAYLYRKAAKARLTVGRKSKNIMCACVYTSCKQGLVPRTILEISLASNIRKKYIARTYQSLVDRLGLPVCPFNSKEFLARIANDVKVSERSRRNALEILHAAEAAGKAYGKNPKALAAASIYLACILNAEQKTQTEITKASGVTSTTIRTRYYELKKFYLEHTET